jgi:hypothetical protein
MSFDLGVWHSDGPLTDQEAGDLYVKLCEQTWIPIEENAAVAAFYAELTNRYPEIDTLPEEGLDNCPWSCAHDRSGLHVLMAMVWSRCGEIAPQVRELAEKHGLVCFDPQESKVYLPPHLKPQPSRIRHWWNRTRMFLGGIAVVAVAALSSPRFPIISGRLKMAICTVVVVGKFTVVFESSSPDKQSESETSNWVPGRESTT